MKTLKEIFKINKGDVVSIVGTGGKTTLMFQLGKELKEQYKVLLTTSTKIFKPDEESYDYIYTSIEDYKNDNIKNGITVLSKDINYENNKLIGIDDNILEHVIDDFDLVLIEADGSRNLPLKGWKKHEPPILSKTNKTIGIISINILEQKISEDIIYGFEEFKNFLSNDDIIDSKVVGRICSSNDGIFKNSRGELYIYINKVDSVEELKKAQDLAKYLKDFITGSPFNFKICYGSLKKGVYYEY